MQNFVLLFLNVSLVTVEIVWLVGLLAIFIENRIFILFTTCIWSIKLHGPIKKIGFRLQVIIDPIVFFNSLNDGDFIGEEDIFAILIILRVATTTFSNDSMKDLM
jgi:hypothetical protein